MKPMSDCGCMEHCNQRAAFAAGVASAELERREAHATAEAEALGEVLGSAEEGVSYQEVERRVRRLTIQPVSKEEA